ncbi:MAG TPA: EamA family transporter [Candidatus Avacidaminococcus intestinavium]|uniref:EamA family transporter n=1 Tax=Candidatus Avacidaminococcus intestinavium TaxID=2840684 RepID=A0A9D1MPI7_9FIRM|nr:EamA family transporter [Candidatus Avacidaminococcus intestinavium]
MNGSADRKKGIILVLIGASLWGASGVAVQYLFENKQLDPTWLVTVRMFFAGFIMLFVEWLRGKDIWQPWRDYYYAKQILLFGVVGMMATQYTYYLAIHYGNAATATILQYLMPVIILGYSILSSKRLPQSKEVIAVVLAMVGTYMLITKGQWNTLAISDTVLFWGIASAFACAFYTVYPRELLFKFPSSWVIGWGMVVGSTVLMPFCLFEPVKGILDWQTFLAMAVVIFLGTIVAFYTYLESTKYIKASEVSALASLEPLTSVILSVGLLGVEFGLVDSLGIVCILGTVFILSRNK